MSDMNQETIKINEDGTIDWEVKIDPEIEAQAAAYEKELIEECGEPSEE